MKTARAENMLADALAWAPAFPATIAIATVALPSWNDGNVGHSLVDVAAIVKKEGSPGFVPCADRIAPFDNVDALSAEHPRYSLGERRYSGTGDSS